MGQYRLDGAVSTRWGSIDSMGSIDIETAYKQSMNIEIVNIEIVNIEIVNIEIVILSGASRSLIARCAVEGPAVCS
jgi:hypothetical protein